MKYLDKAVFAATYKELRGKLQGARKSVQEGNIGSVCGYLEKASRELQALRQLADEASKKDWADFEKQCAQQREKNAK